MRKLLLAVVSALTFSLCLFAQFTGDGSKDKILGTPHDLSKDSNVTGATLVCEFCHSPHKGTMYQGNSDSEPTTAAPLLWNVTLPAGPFTTYGGSSTFQATDIRDPSTASPTKLAAYMTYLCLSCHDGTVTQASFLQLWNDGGNPLQMGTIGTISPPNIGQGGGGNLGLSNDHPVDFTYSPQLATNVGGLQIPLETNAGTGAPYFVTSVGKTVPLPLFKDQSSDTSGRLECATCHNPHSTDSGDNSYYLRMSNVGSALCLNCHSN